MHTLSKTPSRPPGQSPLANRLRSTHRFSPEVVFSSVGLFFGCLFLLITPPFQVADESRHFARAYQLTEQVVASLNGTTPDGLLPASVVAAFVQTERWHSEWATKATAAEIAALMSTDLQPERRAAFAETASYPFVSYLPQIAVMIPLRLAEVNGAVTLYVARLAALLFWLLLTYWAIRIMPFARQLLLFIALLPMTIFQAASLSADSTTLAFSFLFGALCFHVAYRPAAVSYRALALLVGLGLALTATKYVYVFLIGLYALIPYRKFRSPVVYVGGFLLLSGLSLLMLMDAMNIPIHFPITVIAPKSPTVAATGPTIYPQLNFLLESPLNVVRMLVATTQRFGRSYLDGFVGNLGWYGASLPSYLYIVTVVMLWLTALTAGRSNAIRWPQKLLFVAIVSCVTAAIFVGICTDLRENPVPTVQMRGIQGRYFTPVALLIGLLAWNRSPFWHRYRNFIDRTRLPFILFLLVNACVCILMRYYF